MPNKYILTLLLYFYLPVLKANNDDIIFRRISPSGGYGFQAIHSIEQDRQGYMWLAGFDGVFRYDSKEVKRYTQNSEEDGLPSNFITDLHIDAENKIWVCTNMGLGLFNQELQKFQTVSYAYEDGSKADPKLRAIQSDGKGNIWIVDSKYVGYLDRTNNQLVRLTPYVNEPKVLYNDQNDRLWLGTEQGELFQINKKTGEVKRIIDSVGSAVRTIYTTNNRIWVGYEKHGAKIYNRKGKLLKEYKDNKDRKYDLSTTSVRNIWRDTRGYIWLATYHGLFRVVGEKIYRYVQDTHEGLPHNSIFEIFEDKQGGIWVGTWSGGVAYHHHSDNKFINFSHNKSPNSITDNMISAFAENENGSILVGTEQFGLNKFHPFDPQFEKIVIDNEEPVINIKDMLIDKHGGTWIASAFNGVYHKPRNSDQFLHFPPGTEDGLHVSSREVYSLCESDSGIWIGTINGGINFYNHKEGKISFESTETNLKEINKLTIRSLKIDSYDNLWATTTFGLYKIHLPTKTLTRFNTIEKGDKKTKASAFYCITELSDGKLWIGTGSDGVYEYDNKTQKITKCTTNTELDENDIYGIVEDVTNQIWITTNHGLYMTNKTTATVRQFLKTDRIQGDLFNPNAIFKDKKGNLYFGGTNGFSVLEPKPIKTNKRQPNVLINEVSVNNKHITPKAKDRNNYHKVTLQPGNNSLSIHYSCDNYLLPEKNNYRYRLVNYSKEWITDRNTGIAHYSNLNSGDYTFEIQARNNDGIWNDSPTRIEIEIEQYFYKSIFAFLLYFSLLICILFQVSRNYREKAGLKKSLLIEKVQHEQEEELNEAKLKFFTNISHELRTPLTLINGPLQQVLKDPILTDSNKENLDIIQRNTNRLLNLVNQILDFRKLESSHENLNLSSIDAANFISDKTKCFDQKLKENNIIFNVQIENNATFWADEEKLDKIIFNLLSNAIKFTPKQGCITIRVAKGIPQNSVVYEHCKKQGNITGECTSIAISNTGQGIDKSEIETIFHRYKRGKNSDSNTPGTGIGLNLCKEFTLLHEGEITAQGTKQEGACFIISLPEKPKQVHSELSAAGKKIPTIQHLLHEDKDQPRSGTILIVEDNPDLCSYINQLLLPHYYTFTAPNGKVALEIVMEHDIEMIVSDVMMPEMNGFELCSEIKNNVETSHIPVILLTALSSEDNNIAGLRCGVDAYVTKPFEEVFLLAQIKNIQDQRKRLAKNFPRHIITGKKLKYNDLDNIFIQNAEDVIIANLTNMQFSVDYMAHEIGISRSQMHRKLKQLTDHSASEFINIIKVKEATKYFDENNKTLEEIAFLTGFSSNSYLTKCFKKIHGITPSEYRRQMDKQQ